MACTNCHRDSIDNFRSVYDGSGIDCICLPTRKWAGVIAVKSPGSSEQGVKGREFKTASICISTVFSSSKVIFWFPTTLFRWCLTDFTPASQIPPKCGLLGGIKLQAIARLPQNSVNRSMCYSCANSLANCSSSFSAPVKFVALSEYILLTGPRLPINRRSSQTGHQIKMYCACAQTHK